MNDISRPAMNAITEIPQEHLDGFWMPFTANRHFKSRPRLLASASGMYYTTPEGRRILDGTAGLWCVNAGHCRKPIVEAIQKTAATLDYAPTFQMGHPLGFQLSEVLLNTAGSHFSQVFYANSGSEAVDSAMKIALAYHRLRGEGQRTRFIGRERGYHGVGFGGISVGGIPGNRKLFGSMLPHVDHLPHTHNLEKNAFSKGQPAWGEHLADELERIVALHDPSNIAAVIVEPVAGSTGILVPPKGYLERLRALCDKHGLLLIFDEVITGFGRVGQPFGFQRFGVVPDLFTVAKGINNAAVPMSAVFTRKGIYEAFMSGPEHLIEFAHGYTYSAHPLACAAALAAHQVYEDEGLFTRAGDGPGGLGPVWQEALHSLRGEPHVIDIRTIGLMGGIELEPRADGATKRALEAHVRAFFEEDLMVRYTGDTIALSPPLIISESEIARIVDALRAVLRRLA
jgi:beta-alanine--pyruvate transaminase